MSKAGVRLAAELERIKVAPPAAVLRLPAGACPATARSAFLAMVKEFHPHRFAREPQEVQALANEVFLLIKEAYDALCAEPVPREEEPDPAQPARSSQTVRFRGANRRPGSGGVRLSPSTRTRRISNHTDLIAALESEEEQRARQIQKALALLEQGKPGEARDRLRELAIASPTDKRVRVYMHYAWGREHQQAGRHEDAAAEFRRALKLDPTFDDAVEALDAVSAGGEKQAGVFGRLFRRGR